MVQRACNTLSMSGADDPAASENIMNATDIALLITTLGGFATALATAYAGWRQARIAERAAERAERKADELEVRLADLLKPTLYVAPASDAQRARFAAATVILRDGRERILAALALPDGRFPAISAAHEGLASRLIGLLPEGAFPQGTVMVQAIAAVRLCATRAAGAASAMGTPEEWRTELERALRSLELATVTAITATPDYAAAWQEISRRYCLSPGA